MIGGKIARPLKGIGSGSLSWLERQAGRRAAATIVERVLKVDRPAGAVGRDVEGSRIGDDQRSAAMQARYGGRADGQAHAQHREG